MELAPGGAVTLGEGWRVFPKPEIPDIPALTGWAEDALGEESP